MKLSVLGFDGDAGNQQKCEKHGLSVHDIESFLLSDRVMVAPDIKHSEKEQRFLAIGRLKNGRSVFVGFTLRGGMIRPITARYMHLKEARRYEKEEDT